MTTIETRLRNALSPDLADQEPSPDLFPRVQRSMADDRRHRRARARRLAVAALVTALVVAFLAAVTELRDDHLLLRWGWVEGMVTLAMIGVTVGLGPLIRRFGRDYATDVFRMTPNAGPALMRLLDVALYLLCAGYLLVQTRVAAQPAWDTYVTAAQLHDDAVRIGGLLLILGVLHGLNLLLLPVIGRLFGLNRRAEQQVSPDPSPDPEP